MANRSAENTSQGYVLCCGCRYFHEWLRPRFAPARSAIWFFRCAVVSSRYIVCLLKNIQIRSMKFAKSYLNLYFIRCHSKTTSCNIKWLLKKKLRIKVLPIGLEWNKCSRVTTSAHLVKFPHSPILHYAFSSWTEKTMTKTMHFHWENRFVLQ